MVRQFLMIAAMVLALCAIAFVGTSFQQPVFVPVDEPNAFDYTRP
jgi:hypothetical protein